jgi:hypothetical protein
VGIYATVSFRAFIASTKEVDHTIYERCLDGEAEAHLIALVCGDPPQEKDRWTLRLLQKRMVQLSYAETVSHETIRTTLKKMNLSLG